MDMPFEGSTSPPAERDYRFNTKKKMLLQRLVHSQLDIPSLNEDTVIVHGVNEIELGGEFTICGRAIPDSNLSIEGWEAVGASFKGSIKKCECRNCLTVVKYYKKLR